MNRTPLFNKDIPSLERSIIQNFKDRYTLSLFRWPSWYNESLDSNYLMEAYFCHASVLQYSDDIINIPNSVLNGMGGTALAIANLGLYFNVQAVELVGARWITGDLDLLKVAGLNVPVYRTGSIE